jgi:hypothetical protein
MPLGKSHNSGCDNFFWGSTINGKDYGLSFRLGLVKLSTVKNCDVRHRYLDTFFSSLALLNLGMGL